MYVAHTDWLVQNFDSIDWSDPDLRIRAHYFVRSSGFISDGDLEPNDVVISQMTTLQELIDHPGWQIATTLLNTPTVVTTWNTSVSVDGDVTTVEIADNGPLTYIGGLIYLDSVALTLTSVSYIEEHGAYGDLGDNNLLSVYRFEQPILFGGVVKDEVDQVSVLRQNIDEGFLFSLDVSDPEEPLLTTPELSATIPLLGWESAHTVHIWLSPTRVNYVANPSFEDDHGVGDEPFGWRSNVTMSYESGGIGPVPREYCGKFEGAEAVKVAEANVFPVSGEISFYSVEAAVSEPGTYKVGVLFWERGMDPDDVVYASKTFEVSAGDGNFQILKTVVNAPEEVWCAQFRVEYEGDSDYFLLDNVLVEPNESQAPYFDGSWDIGQPGDADWYASDVMPRNLVAHRSFSTYYPDRVKVRRYLFGYADTTTDRVGAVYRQVPETNQVIPHWDDVYYSRIHPWAHSVRTPVIDFSAGEKSSVAVLP